MPAVRKRTPSHNPLFVWDYSKPHSPRKRAIGYFNLATGTWVKTRLDPRKHLAHLAGGTPAWDAATYTALGPDLKFLEARVTDGRVFRVSRETFDQHRFEKDFGYGRQFFVEYRYWSVRQKNQTVLPL